MFRFKDLFAKAQKPSSGFDSIPAVPATKIAATPSAAPRSEIAAGQYQSRSDLTEFTVPNGVTVIGKKAFAGCINLEKITLPRTLTEIGAFAFDGCTALREIDIPDSVTKIGNRAFYQCKALERFRFPKGMRGTEIENGMFYDCISLETVELPDKLSGKFGNVFPHCECLREITLPEGIAAIGSFTFEYCDLLETVAIPSTVKKIEYKAFLSCKGLREMFIPDTVKILDAYCTFADCISMERIRLPVGITFRHNFPEEDGKDAAGCCFAECTALKTVILGTRPFALEGPLNDNALRLMYAELATEGDRQAQEIVQKDIDRVLEALVYADNAATAGKLLDCLPAASFTEDVLASAADCAGMAGAEGIYQAVTRYAEQHGIRLHLD